jgi:sortase (surface protein transpeptidase)
VPAVTATTPPTPSTTATTLPLSPLASILGEAVSAQPVAPTVDIEPRSITINAIDVAAVPVRSVGVTPNGQLEIPGADEAGWYRLGAAPGQPGATVIAAHVSWQGQRGPFLRLDELEPGALVELALADATTRTYQVVARAQHNKLMLPSDEIWRTNGPENLVLITCGGAFDEDRRRYEDNIVVTAVPVG